MLKFFVLNFKVLNYKSPHLPLRLRPLCFYPSDSAYFFSPSHSTPSVLPLRLRPLRIYPSDSAPCHSPPPTPPSAKYFFCSKLGTLCRGEWDWIWGGRPMGSLRSKDLMLNRHAYRRTKELATVNLREGITGSKLSTQVPERKNKGKEDLESPYCCETSDTQV